MPSTIPAARRWLHDQIAAHPSLTSVQIVWGGPVFHLGDDTVGLLGFEPQAVDAVNIGAVSEFDELYTLHVGVSASDGGTSAAAARRVDDRATALAEIVSDLVDANPTLGGTVIVAERDVWTSDGAVYVEQASGFTGWTMFIDVAVDVHGRI